MILHGDSLDRLKELEDNSIDAVITDPPYGYSFMGKDWDKAVPSVDIWAECLRVLKPGAFCLVMSAPRSDVQMHMIRNLEQAGFRIDFTPIYWTYASGFPKAGNIGKLVDKRLGAEREKLAPNPNARLVKRNTASAYERPADTNPDTDMKFLTAPTTDQAKALDGSYAGFQPKPAVEVIIVAMKPLSEKTYVDQALKNGKGITWLDDCRIPTDSPVPTFTRDLSQAHGDKFGAGTKIPTKSNGFTGMGRFPANLLVSDDMLNVPSKGQQAATTGKEPTNSKTNLTHGDYKGYRKAMTPRIEKSASYSRYFDLDKWANTLPFLITPKASKSEKNKGLESFEERSTGFNSPETRINQRLGGDGKPIKHVLNNNHHPTVKPLKLMSYLITLTTREGDTVLDPFCGSGTTCIAAKMLKREYIGIEREQEYVEIAEARLKAHEPELTLL